MKNLPELFPDLRFTPAQLYFTDEQYAHIATEFFGNAGSGYSDRDRAFLQAALFVAIDKSEQASFVFNLYSSFVTAAPSRSIKVLLRKLLQSGAKQAFSKYIDDDPKYSAAGRAGVQYSAFATEWRIRVGLKDDSYLSNFLK